MKKLLFLTISLIVSLAAVEALLRVSVVLLPANPLAPPGRLTIRDPVLGNRFKPGEGGHDKWGFRNDSVYSRADVLVLGDSQTYGSGVQQQENWPSRLQESTGLSVYNMSTGGWGPVESMFLLEQGLTLRPKLVIEAVYSGNDFHDCFNAAYYRLDLDSLKTSDPVLAGAVDSAENAGKYSDRVGATQSFRRREKREGTVYRLKNWLYANLYTYKLLSMTKNRLLASLSAGGSEKKSESSRAAETPASPSMLTAKRWSDSRAAASLYPGHYLIFESGPYRTILTPAYRGVATDIDDPRVREGVQLAVSAIQKMASRLSGQGIEFLVLLIPTKELVYGDLADESSTVNDEARRLYFEMLDKERRIWETLKARLDSAGIAWLDGLPCLRGAFRDGAQPYMVTENGHPDTPGHDALARCVESWIEDRELFSGNR